ncbi:MAG: UPF0175 family protein, partial [Terriglobia bacterium]
KTPRTSFPTLSTALGKLLAPKGSEFPPFPQARRRVYLKKKDFLSERWGAPHGAPRDDIATVGRAFVAVERGEIRMAVKIELLEDIESCLQREWKDLSRHTLESLAIEGSRADVLSRSQVRRMLGFEMRAEVDEFMKRAGIAFDYTLEDFEHDAQTSHYLKGVRAKELQGR